MGINYNNIYVHTDQRQLKVPKKKQKVIFYKTNTLHYITKSIYLKLLH